MKKIIFLFITFNILFLFSCNNKKTVRIESKIVEKQNVLNAFGKIKLGMTVQEFEKVFNKKITLTPSIKVNCFSAKVDSLQVGSEIFLESAYLEFNDNKLFHIGTNKNPLLFDYLKRNFGIENHEEHGFGFTGSFKTNSDSIFCSYEYVNGTSNIAVYKIL